MTYHIRIKKDYSSEVIEDLRKNGAVEIVSKEEAFEIPQWQKDEVISRIEKYKSNPEQLIDEDTFLKFLNEE